MKIACLSLAVLVARNAQSSLARDPKSIVEELYAGVDLPKLVQRMLVVMQEVGACAPGCSAANSDLKAWVRAEDAWSVCRCCSCVELEWEVRRRAVR